MQRILIFIFYQLCNQIHLSLTFTNPNLLFQHTGDREMVITQERWENEYNYMHI